VTKEEFLL